MFVSPSLAEDGSFIEVDESLIFSQENEQKLVFFPEKELDDIRLFYLRERFENLDNYITRDFDGLLDLARLNGITKINRRFRKINLTLAEEDLLIVNFESQLDRKKRILSRRPKLFGYLSYYVWDFCFHRVLPRLRFTKPVYFTLTPRKNRVISITECLGRLVVAGFEIQDVVGGFEIKGYDNKEGLTHVIAKKVSEPKLAKNVNHGLLIRLTRIGFKGKKIKMFKLRTMRPYSEYVQQYMFEKHGTTDGDKIINDFRVTKWGVFLRKFWLDELPMLWNLLKGDLKIVGVRPLSQHKFSMYPEHLQQLRIRVKPGLIPPYYADLPVNQEKFYQSEEDYLISYLNAPLKTDVKYFFKALVNIFLKGARSK